MSSRYQSFIVTATEVSSNQSTDITVKFGSIVLNGIQVENNRTFFYRDIEPSDNASANDDGIYVTDSVNGGKEQEYVNSQKVSSFEDDHKVYLTAEPELLLPATSENAHLGDWEVNFPTAEQSGTSGAYSVYNDANNTTTTTTVEAVPAGLQYITLTFHKLNLSKYTAMYIDLYSEGGVNLFHKEVTNASNANVNSVIQVTRQTDTNSRLVVSLVSQGQVDASNEGYVLTKISGPWATTNDEVTARTPIQNSVTWTDVSDSILYETQTWSYTEAQKYLPAGSEFLNANYRYSYKVPAFPYAGNAIITVKDANDKVRAYFLYPAENAKDANGNYTNVNVLAPATAQSGIYAIHATEEEATKAEENSLKTNGNQAVVDTTTTGITALKASIRVEGLDQTELNAQNGGEIYTSVQWAPVPNKEEVEEVPEYYAMEGQTVVVTAQLYDKNNNLSTDSGANIKFVYGEDETEITKLGQEIGGNGIGNTATVTSFMASTDEKGQVVIKLQGNDIDYVEGLTATAGNYNVALSVEEGVTPSIQLTKANIYWVDLGTTFVDSAIEADVPARTTNFKSSIAEIAKNSTSEVGKTWMIGFLPVAQSYKFKYSNPNTVARVQRPNEFLSIENVPLKYDKSGKGELTSANNAATLTSTEIGQTELNGYIDVESMDTRDVVFRFYNENEEIVSYKNIGTGDILWNTGLNLTMEWTLSGMKVDVLMPNGASVDQDTDTVVYVRVLDNYGNRVASENVSYTITGVNASAAPGKGTTNEKGIMAIELAAPGVTGNSIIAVKVGDDIEENVTINYVNTAKAAFGIKADTDSDYAVEMIAKNQIKLYFTNRINAATLNSRQFNFVQVGSTDVQYQVTSAEMSTDNNAVILTLDKEIVNVSASHMVSVAPYTDSSYGIVYELIDSDGQKVTGSSSYTFKPSERTK